MTYESVFRGFFSSIPPHEYGLTASGYKRILKFRKQHQFFWVN